MNKNSKEIQKEKPSNSSSNIKEKDEKLPENKEDKKNSSISDNFPLSGDIQINSDNLYESETNQKNENK